MKKNLLKIALFLTIIILIVISNHWGIQNYLNLDYIKDHQAQFEANYQNNPTLTLISFFCLYVFVTALSIPGGAVLLTLIGGALFGLVIGTILISFASTIGATLAFLSSRFIFKSYVEDKFDQYISIINQGIEREGVYYLFTLRLIPLFPFFAINLVMGITRMKMLKFFFISQLGMLPGTIIYVNAGRALGSLESVKGILSLEIIGSFVLLGIFPLIAKKILQELKFKKVYKRYVKPSKREYNMLVIGGGAAGLVTSYISSAVKAKVALIEKEKMGGDCLNTGCVPSKALIKSAKIAHQIRNAHRYGIKSTEIDVDFKAVMDRIQTVIKKIEPHDSIERYQGLGVDCFKGHARIISPWEVEINGKILTTESITIATGASPFIPDIPGIESIEPLSSNNLWKLKELPQKLLVVGGGPIGCEMAQSFSRLGSNVTLIEMRDQLLFMEDQDTAELIQKTLECEGVQVKLNHELIRIYDKKVLVSGVEGEVEIEFDQILFAVGRAANVKGFGLEELGVELRKNKTIEANEFLQTTFPNIYVCGDVTGPYQLTHTSAHQAWYCAVNGLFGKFKKFSIDYKVIPWATYTDPEVASVGLNEKRAKQQNVDFELTTYSISGLDRAITDSEDYGFVKVLTKRGSDKILGATIVGQHASDILIEFIQAMKHNIGLEKVLGTIHIYPTMSEANKYVAGNWKKKQTSEKVFNWLERFHRWNRS